MPWEMYARVPEDYKQFYEAHVLWDSEGGWQAIARPTPILFEIFENIRKAGYLRSAGQAADETQGTP